MEFGRLPPGVPNSRSVASAHILVSAHETPLPSQARYAPSLSKTTVLHQRHCRNTRTTYANCILDTTPLQGCITSAFDNKIFTRSSTVEASRASVIASLRRYPQTFGFSHLRDSNTDMVHFLFSLQPSQVQLLMACNKRDLVRPTE